MHPDRGLPQGMTKIPSGNKRHENHTRWWWQSSIARIRVILFFSCMYSFNEIFFTIQLAHKYLEDDQAFSRRSSAARWAPFCTLRKEAKGNSWAGLQPVLTYIGEKKLRGGKEAEKESKEMKLDQLLVPGLEILSLEGTKGKNVGNPWLSLK